MELKFVRLRYIIQKQIWISKKLFVYLYSYLKQYRRRGDGMVDMKDLKSFEQKSLVWVRLPSPVRSLMGKQLSWLEHLPCTQRVMGSTPFFSTLDLQLSRLERLTHNQQVRGSSPRWSTIAEVAHSVEHNLAKVGVASSSLVFRSKGLKWLKYKTEVGQSHLHKSRCRIMAITPSFQVGDVGSIPIICSSGPVSIRPKEKQMFFNY